jgi:endogenous inhibitor of DNA gyrase (YacG/DUF329 family)
MRLYGKDGEQLDVKWKDHRPKCPHCQNVDLEKPASFGRSCAQGGALLMEEMKKRQAPVERQKAAAEKEWAKERKTFVIDRASRSYVESITKYVE